MTTFTFSLDCETPPLHHNQRPHWAAKAKVTKELRELAFWQTKAAMQTIAKPLRLPLRVSLVWTVTDKRTRDRDNPGATLKPIQDGIADALGISDKHTNIVQWVRFEQGTKKSIHIEVVDNASDAVAAMERSEGTA